MEAAEHTVTIQDRRPRRRFLAWAAFGATGILLGSVWAFGFATSSGTVDTDNVAATPVLGVSGGTAASPFANTVSAEEALDITWDGNWGTLAAATSMFEVDLSALPADYNTGTFFVDIYSRGVPTGWTTLQLEFVRQDGACDTVADTFGTPVGATQLMAVTHADAQVTFSGLTAGNVYCFGVAAATPRADDNDGTFLRRPDNAAPDVPLFTAMVNRSA